MNKYEEISKKLKEIRDNNPDAVIVTRTQCNRDGYLHHTLPVRHVMRPQHNLVFVDYIDLLK